jgi:ABC-type dipeptide/oligopeptide/nickel transport system permease subunit
MKYLKRFARDKVGMMSVFVFLSIVIVGATAQWVGPYDACKISLGESFEWPSGAHLLGTDQFGRDILSRVVVGTQVTMKITLSAILLSVLVGSFTGMFVGYLGGKIESLVMRATDIVLVFPPIIIAIVVMAILGPGQISVVLALSSYTLPQFIRLTRGMTLTVKQRGYVEAARALGANYWHIVVRHIWSNISAPVLVQATLMLPVLVLSAASLSFLGVGVQPPIPEWGAMLNDAKASLRYAPYLVLGPGLALFLFVLSANIVGDRFQEFINPQLRK